MQTNSSTEKSRLDRILNSIPQRNFKGKLAEYNAFKATSQLLKSYSFTDQELDILEAEIGEIKKQLSVGKKR